MRSMRPFLCASLIVFASVLSGCGEKSAPSAVEEAAKPVPEQKFADILKKAEAGDADAQLRLGLMYFTGEGVPKDATKAVEWYQKAAAQGSAEAQNRLAGMYFAGVGVPKDAAKSVEWLQKAAAQGDADAQHNLARMYVKGEGVSQDSAKAAEWLQKAAAQGLANSQNNLAAMYGKGEGVPQDAARALEWYRKAAAQGHATAQCNLAGMYARGEGVPKDLVLAYAWLSLAATQGDADSVRDLRGAEGLLSKGELQEAQRLSANWKKGQLLARVGGSSTAQPLSPGGTFDTVADAVLRNDIVEHLSFVHKTFHPECKKAKATSAKTISVTREKASEQWVMAGCGQTYAYKVELIWDWDGKGGVGISVQRDTPD